MRFDLSVTSRRSVQSPLGKENIDIQDMHNIVEGALDHVNPAVAKELS